MKPKKSLGQNFLRNKEALTKIVVAADLGVEQNVLEIGPGEGVLTVELMKKAGRILAVEKDDRLIEKLKLKNEKLKIIRGDILEVNLPKLLEENSFTNYKLVANIPYYITGKILRLFLETQYQPSLMVLLTQKEVAERIVEKDNKSSILSLSVKLFGWVEIIDYVARESFYPVPKVDSAIIKITPHLHQKSKEEIKSLMRIIKIGFASPRKTLLNNLAAGLNKEKLKIEEILVSNEIDLNVRAESLSLVQWENLRNKLE
ncbi:MAG TPA: ribosomal RNA small subunit methyltransferase A [Candidatus Moranbacteria bacterium]|nr:ribosomal RNA small subunit methyltransferase A [Candidatus Moranbacteria bacterium]